MRIAQAVLLAVAFGHQALAQPSDPRPFADADDEAYVSEGGAFVESLTFGSRGVEHYDLRDKTVMLVFVEVMTRWDGSSPYPFVKVRGEWAIRFGVFDPVLNAQV